MDLFYARVLVCVYESSMVCDRNYLYHLSEGIGGGGSHNTNHVPSELQHTPRTRRICVGVIRWSIDMLGLLDLSSFSNSSMQDNLNNCRGQI